MTDLHKAAQQALGYPSLYDITGDIKGLNTLLVPVEEVKQLEEMNRQLREQNTSLDAECGRLEAENAALREALAKPAVPEWISVSEKMPTPGMPVLACYKSGRKIIAFWTPANTVVVSDEDSDIGVYDEATDTWYDPEGWYECVENWDEFSSIFVDAGVVTHWMELPTAPQPKEPT